MAPAPVEPLQSSNDQGVLNMFNHVPITVRQKIWNGEFIELRSLLPKHNDSTLQKVQVVKGEIIVSEKGVVKNFDKIEMWTDAFLIYMAIFLVKHVAFSVHAQYRSLCGAFLRMGRV